MSKQTIDKSYARRRDKKCIPLIPNTFPDEVEVVNHHINDMLTVPLPKAIHISTYSGTDVSTHRELCNNIIKDLYGLEVSKIVGDDLF